MQAVDDPILAAGGIEAIRADRELDLMFDLERFGRQLRSAILLIVVGGAVTIAVIFAGFWHGLATRKACLNTVDSLRQHWNLTNSTGDSTLLLESYTSKTRSDLDGWATVGLIGLMSTIVAVCGLTVPILLGLKRSFRSMYGSMRRSSLFAHVVGHMSSPVSLLDNNGRIVWVNPGYEALSGYSAHELKGNAWLTWMAKTDSSCEMFNRICEAIATGASVQGEVQRRHRRGNPYVVRIELLPILASEKGLLGFQMIETNLTQYYEQINRMQKEQQERFQEEQASKNSSFTYFDAAV